VIKVLTVIGARPQFIKASVVSKSMQESHNITEILVNTGQHFDENMSTVFFDELEMRLPDHNLNVSGGGHGDMTGRMMIGIEKIIEDVRPDWVLVYGDTNSTVAASLCAAKCMTPLAHVEAGLRSFDQYMPEEINRVVTDRLSQVLFCPTHQAVANLRNERRAELGAEILNVGDVMYDVALQAKEFAVDPQIEWLRENFILATIHRAENTDDKVVLMQIVDALNELSRSFCIVLPLHPRTVRRMSEFGLSFDFPVVEPVGYLEMSWLLRHCQCVVTDSGGLQKEAYFSQKPCVTVRERTEWTELVDHGVNRLCLPREIPQVTLEMIDVTVQDSEHLYGNGNASELITRRLCNDR